MEEAEPWSDHQLTAMRSILLDWGNLSLGDISIVTQCIRNPAAMCLTVRGSAHARFWQEIVSIGWAEHLYSPIDPYDHDPEPLAFRLTQGGERPLSHFLVFYDLLNMGACTPAIDTQATQTACFECIKAQKGGTPAETIRQAPTLTNARFAVRVWSSLALLFVGAAIGGALSS